jgi:hypothetical protein
MHICNKKTTTKNEKIENRRLYLIVLSKHFKKDMNCEESLIPPCTASSSFQISTLNAMKSIIFNDFF